MCGGGVTDRLGSASRSKQSMKADPMLREGDLTTAVFNFLKKVTGQQQRETESSGAEVFAIS